MLRTEAIQKFLHQQPYAMCKLYTPDMEVQINVAQEDGEPIKGTYAGIKWMGYTDGLITWKSFRIPWNAKDNPYYEDKPITYPIDKYVEAIGMTGWDWKNRVSRWVGFDFDSLVSHKKGLTDAELQDIQSTLATVPFISLYTSTSSAGLHPYARCLVENVKNHTEHAALARAILAKIVTLTSLPLEAKVDAYGGNMWVWHRRAILNKSYQCIKKASTLLETPINWRDYLSTSTNTTKPVDSLSAAHGHIELDAEHKKLLNWFEKSDCLWWYDPEKQMLVCHTADLKKVHTELSLRGIFETIATGKDHGRDQNCYAFPSNNRGGWIIRRHTKGVRESSCWFSDRSGWTTCYFNTLPSCRAASEQVGGIEGEKEYNFRTLKQCIEAINLMGIDYECPETYQYRKAILKQKNKKIVIEFLFLEDDELPDWILKGKKWQKVFLLPELVFEEQLPDFLVRHTVSENSDQGWYVFASKWIHEPKYNITNVLISQGYRRDQLESILGRCITNPWEQTTQPFQPEYPGKRQWNRNAPQFLYTPKLGKHPHWDLILKHCGRELNGVLKDNKWCYENGILEGILYLQYWIAAMFQQPFEPTPYLVFFGDQNTGKSIFHEALELLFYPGYMKAESSLTNSSGFTGELENIILCVVEETDLSRKGYAADRIKDWVTSPYLLIHTKGVTPYLKPNCTHWIQCTNDLSYCPIFPGDTRIVSIEVTALDTEIPKPDLLERCKLEAPAFLYTLLNINLPPSNSRLVIPVVETKSKVIQQELQRSSLEKFIAEQVFLRHGHVVLLSDFTKRFLDWLDITEKINWTSRRIAKELVKLKFIKGKCGNQNMVYIGNISFEPVEEEKPYRLQRDRLVQ